MKMDRKTSGSKMRKGSMLMFLLMLLCVGCGTIETETRTETPEEEDKVQIGMCFDSFVIERWQRDRDAFVSTAKELGAEVNVQNANGDVEEQIRQIEYFIEKKMDVIVIICIDSDNEKVRDVVKKAKNENIKVIAYDRLIRNANVDLYITFDNEEVGRIMAQAIVENGSKGDEVLMIGGSPTDNNVPLVEKGFRQVLQNNGMAVLDSVHLENWKPELGEAYVYEHPYMMAEADAVMCGNDSIATKVVHAMAEKRLAGKITVVGQDADLEACQRIVEGTQVMTVYKPVEKLAQAAAEYAVLLAQGDNLIPGKAGTDSQITWISDGTSEVPYVGLEPIRVDRDNINEVIIGSGFHLKEDVYLNRPDLMP